MYSLEDGQFVGMSVEEVVAYLEAHGYEFEYEPETEEEAGSIYVGGEYYDDHYEMEFYDGVCEESYLVEWD